MSADAAHALPPGTELGEYILTGVLGVGGFGIVYSADERKIGGKVAIKEYMPESLATRTDGLTVKARSSRTEATFERGLEHFLQEASTLRRFRHPSIVQVYAYWEANGTAYMAMPLYAGRTLKDELKTRGPSPDEAWLRGVLNCLLDVLDVLHGQNVWHRDIAPDNILLNEGQPVLLDFGAARRVIGEETHDLTAVLKPGYAPWEQYAEVPGLEQGPWTDIYALSAVLYYAISGKVPLVAVARVHDDTLKAAAEIAAGRYSEELLNAIDRGLKVHPSERIRSVAQFRQIVNAKPSKGNRAPGVGRATRQLSSATRGLSPKTWVWGALSIAIAAMVGYLFYEILHADLPRFASQQNQASRAVEAEPVHSDARMTPHSINLPPADWNQIVNALVERSTPGLIVRAEVNPKRVKIGHPVKFVVESGERGGYLYIFLVGTEGKVLNLIFPTALEGSRNTIKARTVVTVPERGAIVARPPSGINRVVAVISSNPITTQGTQWRMDPSTLLESLSLSDALAAAGSSGGPAQVLGKFECADQATACTSPYGAISLSFEALPNE